MELGEAAIYGIAESASVILPDVRSCRLNRTGMPIAPGVHGAELPLQE